MKRPPAVIEPFINPHCTIIANIIEGIIAIA